MSGWPELAKENAKHVHELLTQMAELTRERDDARELALKGICHDAVGDEWGHFPCPYRKRAEAAERERDALRERIGDAPNNPEVFDRIRELEAERDVLRAENVGLREQIKEAESLITKFADERDALREQLAEAETALRMWDGTVQWPWNDNPSIAYFAKHGA